MVRSILEHCPVVWRPSSKYPKTYNLINQGYSSNILLYHAQYKQLNTLPVRYLFNFQDIKRFQLIVHAMLCIKLPSYLHLFEGSSRLRFTHLDHLRIITKTVPAGLFNETSKSGFANSYFYTTHLLLNRLPQTLREIISQSKN